MAHHRRPRKSPEEILAQRIAAYYSFREFVAWVEDDSSTTEAPCPQYVEQVERWEAEMVGLLKLQRTFEGRHPNHPDVRHACVVIRQWDENGRHGAIMHEGETFRQAAERHHNRVNFSDAVKQSLRNDAFESAWNTRVRLAA